MCGGPPFLLPGVSASREEFQQCLDNAISQEDIISCAEKRDAQAKVFEDGECETERAQSGRQGGLPAGKKAKLRMTSSSREMV